MRTRVLGTAVARSRLRRGVLGTLATLLLAFALAAPAGAQDSKGTNFWLTFPGNFSDQELTLFITGDTATTGTVAIPGLLAFSAPFTVTPGTVTPVALPTDAQLQSSDTVEDKGIHVTSNAEVTVYGLNRVQFTTDAYLGLPVDALGTDYINLGYKNVNIVNATQFGIVAAENGTVATITPTETTDGHTAGVPYTINLNQGQTYLLRNTDAAPADLSGSLVTSTKPIALFGGHQCANIPPDAIACDHIVEQLPATTTWGERFVSVPLETRLNGDTFRILASQDGTTVQLNGATIATLNRGQIHEQIIEGSAQITANNPILVMQYSNSSTFDGVTSDPFQMMIPPFEQFLAGYTITTPAAGFAQNFANLEVPNSSVGSVTKDGVAIPASEFTAIGSSGFSGAQVEITLGSHSFQGPLPFGVQVYGFADFDSYGYPGGLSLSEVATVATVELTPETATNPVGTQHCVTATVTDSNGQPVEGVRVDFEVSGANSRTGFAFTNAQGKAEFCYTGTNAGVDTIKVSVGSLSDTATKTWTQGPPPDTTPPSCVLFRTAVDGNGKKFIEIRVKDDGSGLKSIVVNESTNSTTPVPPFTVGTNDPVFVRGTKINQSQGSRVTITVEDVAGNKTTCDPELLSLKIGRRGVARYTVRGLPQAESKIRIKNGKKGLRRLVVVVNGRRYQQRLRSGRVHTMNVARAMRSGKRNTMTLIAYGRRGASATIVIHD